MRMLSASRTWRMPISSRRTIDSLRSCPVSPLTSIFLPLPRLPRASNVTLDLLSHKYRIQRVLLQDHAPSPSPRPIRPSPSTLHPLERRTRPTSPLSGTRRPVRNWSATSDMRGGVTRSTPLPRRPLRILVGPPALPIRIPTRRPRLPSLGRCTTRRHRRSRHATRLPRTGHTLPLTSRTRRKNRRLQRAVNATPTSRFGSIYP